MCEHYRRWQALGAVPGIVSKVPPPLDELESDHGARLAIGGRLLENRLGFRLSLGDKEALVVEGPPFEELTECVLGRSLLKEPLREPPWIGDQPFLSEPSCQLLGVEDVARAVLQRGAYDGRSHIEVHPVILHRDAAALPLGLIEVA